MKNIILVLSILVATNSAFAKSESVSPETSANITAMAWVDQVQTLPSNTVKGRFVKLLSYTGDTAMNGTSVLLAVYNDDAADFNVYTLANIRDYKLLPSQKDGFLKISLDTEKMNAEGEIVRTKSILYVNLLNSHESNGVIEIEEVK